MKKGHFFFKVQFIRRLTGDATKNGRQDVTACGQVMNGKRGQFPELGQREKDKGRREKRG